MARASSRRRSRSNRRGRRSPRRRSPSRRRRSPPRGGYGGKGDRFGGKGGFPSSQPVGEFRAPSGPPPASLAALKPPPSMAELNSDPNKHNSAWLESLSVAKLRW